MDFRRNVKISTQLVGIVIILIGLMSLVGGIGYYYINSLGTDLDEVHDTAEAVKGIATMRINLWANDANIAALTTTSDAARQQVLLADLKKRTAHNAELMQLFASHRLTAFEKEQVDKYHSLEVRFRNERQKAIDLALSGDRAQAQLHYEQNAEKINDQMNSLLIELTDYNDQESKAATAQGDRDSRFASRFAKRTILGVTAAAAVIGLGAGLLLARTIARRLRESVAVVETVAQGNLAVTVNQDGYNDEIGKLNAAMTAMVVSLRQVITQVAMSAELVAASSQELTANADQSAQVSQQMASSVTDTAHGTERQVQAIRHALTEVEQVAAGSRQIESSVVTITDRAGQSAAAAKRGSEAVTSVIKQMQHIETTVSQSAAVVVRLEAHSKEIGQIVELIAGIADQTNLLALNAAIEAARAGEQGRGFAVVAEEVRKLAEESQSAAKQIAQLIRDIQSQTQDAAATMQDGTREVKRGAEVVVEAGQSLEEIEQLVQQVSGLTQGAVVATRQMGEGAQRIVKLVREIEEYSKNISAQSQNISAGTEEQSAGMEEIASASHGLANMAQDLQVAVNKFSV